MRKYYIDEMVKALSGLIISEEPVRATLEEYWKDKIADVWTIEDVKGRAYDTEEIGLSNTEAKTILQEVQRIYDAESGINWYVIDAGIEEFQATRNTQKGRN